MFVKRELAAGGEEEVELRAATVQAVETLRAVVVEVHGVELPSAVALDWWLWAMGERARAETPPHHRTLTPYY